MLDGLLIPLVVVSCIEEARVQWVVYLHLDVVVLVLVVVLLDVVDHVVDALVLLINGVRAHGLCWVHWMV